MEWLLVVRWIHIVTGILWVGLLFFFNLINVPAMKVMDEGARPAVITTVLPRLLFWFIHAAWATVLSGFVLVYPMYWRDGDLFNSNSDRTIFSGLILGLVLLFNALAIARPNMNRMIASAARREMPNPQWMRTTLLAGRLNFVLSFPMLLFMAGASHFPLDWPRIILYGVISAAVAAAILGRIQE